MVALVKGFSELDPQLRMQLRLMMRHIEEQELRIKQLEVRVKQLEVCQ